jgi:Fission yeast centromere protein N-terminal domain/Tc5 transposase DNA-binding domain
MSTADKPKQRKSFTDLERQRLRLYHHNYPSLTPQQLASWFESETGRRVANSSVYDILSDKYAYLDSTEATVAVRKKKGPQWADLEDALFQWWLDLQPRNINGKQLKTKATEIWQTLPSCHGKKAPSFSDGWLSNWRVRNGIAQSTTTMELMQDNREVKGSGEVQNTPLASVSCAGESILYSQLLGWTIPNQAASFAMPQEGRTFLSDIKFPRSDQRTMSNPKSLWTPPSRTHLFPVIGSSEQYTTYSRTCGTQVQKHHEIKRAKLAPSRSLNAADPVNFLPPSTNFEAVKFFEKEEWNGVRELFLKCKPQTEHDPVLPGKVVLDVLAPMVSDLGFSQKSYPEVSGSHYHLFGYRQGSVAEFNLRKAIGLLFVAEVFRLQQAKEYSERVIYEEWFLDFIDHNVLWSASPDRTDPATAQGQHSPSYTYSRKKTVQRQRNLPCTTSFVSARTKGGRMDILTRTFTNAGNRNNTQAVEHFQASIVITPPAGVHSVPQTIIHLGTETSKFISITSTPIITYRNIRPEDSEVFKVAMLGNSRDLQILLSSGEASLSDCDSQGRSLINVSQET